MILNNAGTQEPISRAIETYVSPSMLHCGIRVYRLHAIPNCSNTDLVDRAQFDAYSLLQLGDRIHESSGHQRGWPFPGHQVFSSAAEKEANKGCGQHQLCVWLHFCKFQGRLWRDASSIQLQQGGHQYAYAFLTQTHPAACGYMCVSFGTHTSARGLALHCWHTEWLHACALRCYIWCCRDGCLGQ